jgi:DNA mismatch repair protein MutH
VGSLIERALGASAGPRAVHDFPHLGVELKTIPVDTELRPRESTFVCKISLAGAEHAEWETSWARRKLQRVLFVPVVLRTHVGSPVLFSPSAAEAEVLRADFDEIMGAIGTGRIEELDARTGTYLQLRPKARDGSARELMWDPDGEAISTVPRGLYLRARFTAAVLRRAPGG